MHRFVSVASLASLPVSIHCHSSRLTQRAYRCIPRPVIQNSHRHSIESKPLPKPSSYQHAATDLLATCSQLDDRSKSGLLRRRRRGHNESSKRHLAIRARTQLASRLSQRLDVCHLARPPCSVPTDSFSLVKQSSRRQWRLATI